MTLPLFAMFSTMPWWAWAGFLAFVLMMLALDLGVFNRRPHVVSLKEALAWCAVWFGLAMAFNLLLALNMPAAPGSNPPLEFFTGYIIELCLSVDNVFVFIVIFQYFRVEPRHQHRVLFWGVLGAVVMRAIFIFAGVSLINRFHGIIGEHIGMPADQTFVCGMSLGYADPTRIENSLVTEREPVSGFTRFMA